MLQKLKNKEWFMSTVWILVIIGGTFLTIWGSYNLNSEWGRADLLRQSHTIPDFLLIDFEVKAELDSTITQQILSEISSKYHVAGETFDEQDKIHTISFFDERVFKENKQAKKNYKLSKNIYNQMRDFELIGDAHSKDSSVSIGLTKNTNKVIFTKNDISLKESYIEVRSYNQQTNEFNIFYHNIQLNVENRRLSKFLTDLDKGDLRLYLITKSDIKELKNIKLKTKTTEYFQASEITNEGIRYSAKLNLLLN